MTSNEWLFLLNIGVDCQKKPFPEYLRVRYSLLAHCLLLGFFQGTIFTWFECTGDLDIKGLGSNTSNDFRYITLLGMKIIEFLLDRALADTAISSLKSCRKSTPATQPSWVLIWQSRMISPVIVLTTILFQWSLEILFPCKSSHVRKNRFTPALGQNFTGYRVCMTCSVPSTCCTLTQSFPFL